MLCSFSTLVDRNFSFSVSEEHSCQSEFIPPLKLRSRRLNVLEVHGITASRKIHRWANKKINFYYLALANDNWFNLSLFKFHWIRRSLVLYREIAGCTLRETREGLGTWPRAHPHSGSALKKIYVSCSGSYSHHVQFCTFYVYVQDFHPGGFE